MQFSSLTAAFLHHPLPHPLVCSSACSLPLSMPAHRAASLRPAVPVLRWSTSNPLPPTSETTVLPLPHRLTRNPASPHPKACRLAPCAHPREPQLTIRRRHRRFFFFLRRSPQPDGIQAENLLHPYAGEFILQPRKRLEVHRPWQTSHAFCRCHAGRV